MSVDIPLFQDLHQGRSTRKPGVVHALSLTRVTSGSMRGNLNKCVQRRCSDLWQAQPPASGAHVSVDSSPHNGCFSPTVCLCETIADEASDARYMVRSVRCPAGEVHSRLDAKTLDFSCPASDRTHSSLSLAYKQRQHGNLYTRQPLMIHADALVAASPGQTPCDYFNLFNSLHF